MNNSDIIIFDLDSTLVRIEGLDWLAKRKGKYDEVSQLTRKSMGGEIGMNKAMKAKMEMIAPSYQDLIALGKEYCRTIVKDASIVIKKLQEEGKDVWIITGNFRPAVEILANKLGISKNHIICNQIWFDDKGNYAGFDINNPLSSNNGKAAVIKKAFPKGKRKVLVGDGATDLEAKDQVDLFVAYAGVVQRDSICKRADKIIKSESLLPLLGYVLG